MNLIIICLIIYGFISMAMVLFAYNLGLKSVSEKKEEKNSIKPFLKTGKVKMTKEEKEALNKMNIALSNIENYDGTSRGQKKVV